MPLGTTVASQVARQTSYRWIAGVRYFTNCEPDFVVEAALTLRLLTFSPWVSRLAGRYQA